MAMASLAWFCFVLLLLLHSLSVLAKQTFIVHMNYHLKPLSYSTHHDWYTAHLLSLLPDSSLLYTYTTAFHGFAAALDPDQAESLHRSDAVLGVYEDSIYTLHTTRTPKFLGLETDLGLLAGRRIQDLEQASQDVIIGVLDTGVWPESKSFDDTGMAEVPPRWRGKCESGVDFSPSLCNKKLIGARSFSEGFRMASGESSIMQTKENQSARDRDGHGTHTASTAVGAHVANASLLGYAGGTARGMATRARVAVYKVCWSRGCVSSDILAGMDRAIVDGVDVLSLSLGSGAAAYYNDMIAIGAFTAMEKGIFVSCSAGNSGPRRTTLSNEAPWITTVGAGTLDRDFPAYAQLGNGSRVAGASLYSGTGMGTKPVGLVYGNGNSSSSEMCLRGSLEPGLVRGKVVVCDRGSSSRTEKGLVVRNAGGVGVIITNTAVSGGEDPIADSHLIPAVNVGKKVGDLIKAYAQSDANPTALLTFGGTVLDVRPSPVVASFSSRGPSWVTPYILKPDLIGPGVNILAAWSGLVGPTNLEIDTRRTQFNIISGTSMSCPHITGLAALLKAAHPDWSPSAIKSALMTTAYTHDNTKAPIRDAAAWGAISNPWAYGSGHVDPQKALSPGLVYNASAQDYIAFLCTLGYDTEQMQIITKRSNIRCSQRFTDPGGLNYPSFAVVFNNTRIVQYTRELTNVGPAGSVYNVTVGGPSIVTVTVKPTKLVFSEVGVKLRYTVTFLAKRGLKRMTEPAFGWLAWSNEQHRVRSPVSYQWVGV